MTTPKMHRQRVSETIAPLLRIRDVAIGDLLDAPRRLAEEVRSPIDVPGFDNSSMDGYALAASTLTELLPGSPRTGSMFEVGPIPVRGRVAAGARGETVAPGTAVEIMTGAPLPPGTDTAVKIEDTRPGAFEATEITVALPAEPAAAAHPAGATRDASSAADASAVVESGSFVRTQGSDVQAGQTVLHAGTMLTPAHLGVAASCGITELPVAIPPRVLVVSTGDEITAEAAAGIHDANSITLTAGLRRIGVEAQILIVPDDPQQLLEAVRASEAELVISTGGISKGAHEVVKLAAELDETQTMVFEPIGMQPGGPQGCGRLADHAWVALPGNPVSALISFEMFIRPALLGLTGDEAPRPVEFHPLAHELDEQPPSSKLQIRRARLTDHGLELVGGSRSHLLHSYAQSTHLVFIPPTDPPAEPDDPFTGEGDRLRTWTIA